MAQLYLAGVGFKSREQVFYKYFANELKKSNVKVPQCYYSDVFPLTTHVFFLLEAINIDGIVNVPLADSMAKNQEICLFLLYRFDNETLKRYYNSWELAHCAETLLHKLSQKKALSKSCGTYKNPAALGKLADHSN